jgi:hypothetical protein
MSEIVNVDNFARAETARMFDGILAQAGAINRWLHLRGPVPLDQQTVIRMNRDTLYSGAVVDIGEGAVLEIPDVGDRYLSVQVTNEDHTPATKCGTSSAATRSSSTSTMSVSATRRACGGTTLRMGLVRGTQPPGSGHPRGLGGRPSPVPEQQASLHPHP